MNRRQLFGFFGGAVVAPRAPEPSFVETTASSARRAQAAYIRDLERKLGGIDVAQKVWTSPTCGYFYLPSHDFADSVALNTQAGWHPIARKNQP